MGRRLGRELGELDQVEARGPGAGSAMSCASAMTMVMPGAGEPDQVEPAR